MAIFNFSRAWRRCERTVAGSSPRRSPSSSVSHNKLALRDFLTWAMNNGHMPKLSPPPIQRRQGDSSMTQHKRLTLLRKIPTPVPEPFAGLLLAAASQRQNMSTATTPSLRYLFPGRRAGQPINPYTLYPAMRELGIPTQTARTSPLPDASQDPSDAFRSDPLIQPRAVQVGAQHQRRTDRQGREEPDQRFLTGRRVDQHPVTGTDAVHLRDPDRDRAVPGVGAPIDRRRGV
jgi:hypothetical protein